MRAYMYACVMYVHVRMFAGYFFSIFRRHPDFDKLDLYVTKQVIVTFLEDVLNFPRKAPKLQPLSKGSIAGIAWAQRYVFACPCTETEDIDACRKGSRRRQRPNSKIGKEVCIFCEGAAGASAAARLCP